MTVKREKPMILYTDASVYNNGQKGEQEAFYAVFLDDGTTDEEGNLTGRMVAYEELGDASVNEGEYRGVIAALRWISDEDIDHDVVVITDSKLVWGHVMDNWRCAALDKDGNPSKLPILRDKVRELLAITEARLIWKRRHRNLAGWFFEKEVERRRKEKYRDKKERRRTKRKRVRAWTLDNPEVSGYAGRGIGGDSGLSE